MRRAPSSVRMGVILGFAGILVAGSIGVASQAADATQRSKTATVTVLHAIPAGVGSVDVYADRRKVAASLSPGQLRTTQIPAGEYDISIVPAGDAPSSPSRLLEMTDARIPAGADVTIAAHLDSRGKPDITAFTNKTRTVGMGMGRLTVRNIADAPKLDVRARGSVMFDGIASGREADTGLMAGNYDLRVSESGERSPVMARTTGRIRNEAGRSDMGNNVILYLWGDATMGRLRTTIQEVQLDLN
jgi:hypothetical protein